MHLANTAASQHLCSDASNAANAHNDDAVAPDVLNESVRMMMTQLTH